MEKTNRTMINNAVRLVLIIAAFSVLGMSGITGDMDPNDIPTPETNYRAKVIDRSETEVEVVELSIDGDVFLKGLLGLSQVAINFDRINSIDFLPTPDNKKVSARASLKDGQMVEVIISRNLDIYGKTSYGVIQVRSKDLKRVELLGKIETKKPSAKNP